MMMMMKNMLTLKVWWLQLGLVYFFASFSLSSSLSSSSSLFSSSSSLSSFSSKETSSKVDSSSSSSTCNYISYYGSPFAVDRCNSRYERYNSNGDVWQSSYIFRCQDHGTRVDLEYYENYNCTGIPYYTVLNYSNNFAFNCHGTHECDISLTGYPLDYPCVDGYTDWYWYTVYVRDICTYDSQSVASANAYCAPDSFSSKPELYLSYYYQYTEMCQDGYIYNDFYLDGQCPYNSSYIRYRVNCSAAEEPLPIPTPQTHYCEINDCDYHYSTQPPLEPINNNDVESCAYANFYGQPLVPNICMFSYGYSFMAKCVENNTKVVMYYWDGSPDCKNSSNSDFYVTETGIADFNCIGHNRCHAEYLMYDLNYANSGHSSCEEADEVATRYMYALNVCTNYWGSGYMLTCEDDTLSFLEYWSETTCPEKQGSLYWQITDGCTDQGHYGYYWSSIKYEVTCAINNNSSSTSSSSSSSNQTIFIIVGVTVALVVLGLIAVAVITYTTRTSRFRNVAIDKTHMLPEESFSHEEKHIFNPSRDGSGVGVGVDDGAAVFTTNDSSPRAHHTDNTPIETQPEKEII